MGSGSSAYDRRALEICVFVHLAGALETGEVYIEGAESFADYRTQLLPWAECETRLPGYCAALGIPERGEDFAAALKNELAILVAEVDAGFPDNTELTVDADGIPHVKQLETEQPTGLAEFEQEPRARMSERHMLDIRPPWNRKTSGDGASTNGHVARVCCRWPAPVLSVSLRRLRSIHAVECRRRSWLRPLI